MFEFGKKGPPDASDEGPSREAARHETAGSTQAAPKPRAAAASGARHEAAVIGPSIQIDGDLRGQEDLLIDGEVSGTVQLRNNSLTVGAQGKIKANVYANEVFVDGFVEGDLYASDRVAIRKTAQVRGNVTSPRVSLEEGARFKGSIEMDSEAVDSALGKSRGASAPPSVAAAAPKTAAPDNKAAGPAGGGGTARTGLAG